MLLLSRTSFQARDKQKGFKGTDTIIGRWQNANKSLIIGQERRKGKNTEMKVSYICRLGCAIRLFCLTYKQVFFSNKLGAKLGCKK